MNNKSKMFFNGFAHRAVKFCVFRENVEDKMGDISKQPRDATGLLTSPSMYCPSQNLWIKIQVCSLDGCAIKMLSLKKF